MEVSPERGRMGGCGYVCKLEACTLQHCGKIKKERERVIKENMIHRVDQLWTLEGSHDLHSCDEVQNYDLWPISL